MKICGMPLYAVPLAVLLALPAVARRDMHQVILRPVRGKLRSQLTDLAILPIERTLLVSVGNGHAPAAHAIRARLADLRRSQARRIGREVLDLAGL